MTVGMIFEIMDEALIDLEEVSNDDIDSVRKATQADMDAI